MCGFKCSIRVVTIALIIQSGHLISTGVHNGTAEILWNLSQLAVQSRQNHPPPENYPTQFQLHPEKFARYTGPVKPSLASRGQYGLIKNQQNFYRPHPNTQQLNLPYFQRPHPYPQRPYIAYPPGLPKPIPALPPGYQQYQQSLGYPPQSFTQALQRIARNDNLRCVSRLLCELTSGPSSEQKQESSLPINFNMESLIGLLSVMSGPQTSALLEFGRAALLGYTAKGNTKSCSYAYPQCPQDPDKLVDYLNNYNGGFFRYFNGVPPNRQPQNLQQFPYLPQPIPPYYPQNGNYHPRGRIVAEERILTNNNNNIHQDFNIDLYQNEIKFPDVSFERDLFVFPQNEENDLNKYKQDGFFKDHSPRKEKAVSFPTSDFDFKMSLPNVKQVNMIFPDRTGTGELRLDTDDFNVDYNRQKHYVTGRFENNFGSHTYFK